jgi:lycopene beta-cyclase
MPSPFQELIVNHYDIIIAGGGLAGLSLAYQLALSPLRDRSILILDYSKKERNDRVWAYWADRPLPFDHLAHQSWDTFRFIGPGYAADIPLQNYRYLLIQGLDLYRWARKNLGEMANITFRNGRIEHIEDGPTGAQVIVDGQAISGRWVFDSCYRPEDRLPGQDPYQDLKLHFSGWEIQTSEPRFTPQVATLMDFRTPQRGETRFFYVLPFSKRRALVEYTIFSSAALGRQAYDQALSNYLREVQRVTTYHILRHESGCLPITDRPFARRLGQHIMAIGLKGGRFKPSTGYAFSRIQVDSAAIVRSLRENDHPFGVPADPWRFRLFDAILLDVMSRQGDQMATVFSELFKNNPIERVLGFLDEGVSPWEQLKILPTVPPRPFIGAALRYFLPGPMAKPGQRPRSAGDKPHLALE